MLTLERAKALRFGEVLVINGRRWKVNGKVQTWKRDASRIRVPLKHGLYSYDALDESTLALVDYIEGEQ